MHLLHQSCQLAGGETALWVLEGVGQLSLQPGRCRYRFFSLLYLFVTSAPADLDAAAFDCFEAPGLGFSLVADVSAVAAAVASLALAAVVVVTTCCCSGAGAALSVDGFCASTIFC